MTKLSFTFLALGAAAVSVLAGSASAQAPLVPQRVSPVAHRHSIARRPSPTAEPPVLSGASLVSAPLLGSDAMRGPLVPRDRFRAGSAAAAPDWTFIGPAGVLNAGGAIGANPQTVSGRVADMAVDPKDSNTFYVASAGGGVWKTTDGGASYLPLTDYLGNTAMGSIAVARSDNHVIYAGTGEANNSGDSKYGIGLLKSTDSGATWAVIPGPENAFVRRAISRIAVDPTNANTVYLTVSDFAANGLGGNTGVWKSTDGGVHWTNTTAVAGLTSNEPYSDLVINPKTPGILYAAIGNLFGSDSNGVYKTIDGGAHWAKLAGGLPFANAGRIALAIAPSSPTTLYASISDNGSTGGSFGALVGLYKTTNGGANWTKKSAAPNYLGGQGWYDNTVVVSPTNANAVFAAGVVNYNAADYTQLYTLVGSTNGGTTFHDYSVGKGFLGPHTDTHMLTFTADGKKLLDGNDGGVWRLNNPSVSNPHGPTQDPSDPNNFLDNSNLLWDDVNANLGTIQFTGIALHPTDPQIAYGGSQDNGTEMTTGDLAWTQVRQGDGGFVRVDQTDPSTIYHEYYGISLERSDDGGQTWVYLGGETGINQNDPQPADGEDPAAFYVPYKLDPANQSRIIYGTDHVYESKNKGDLFTIIGTPGVAGFNPSDTVLDTIGVYGSTIYAAAGGSLYATFNDGSQWADRSVPGHPGLSDIYVNPSNPQDVIVTKGSFRDGGIPGKVFRSTNGGQTWKDITSNLPDEPFNAVKLDKKSGVLYAGGDDGVYSSANFGGTWAKTSNEATGLPTVQVVDLALTNATGILGAGTHGRGMWTLPLSTVKATPNLSISVTLKRLNSLQVQATITVSNAGTTNSPAGAGAADALNTVITSITSNGVSLGSLNVGIVPAYGQAPSQTLIINTNRSGPAIVRFKGTYAGGSFDISVQVTVP